MTRSLAHALALLLAGCSAGASLAPSASTAPSASPIASPPAALSPTPAATPSPTAKPSPPVSPATPVAWSKLDQGASHPSAREDHTWTLDPDSRVAYLFGGRAGSAAFADLWAFDLAAGTWQELAPAGEAPTKRFGHEAAWVPGQGLVVFAGQASATAFFNDLWAYDPAANRWTKLPATGDVPVARYGTCSGLGPDGRLWISHGFTEDRARFADTKAYDFQNGEWEDVTPGGQLPVERCLHGCWWTATGGFALYAGQTTGVEALGDLWLLEGAGSSGATWAGQTGELPSVRNLYAYATRGGDAFVFGGRGDGQYRNDLYRFAGGVAPAPVAIEGDPPPGRAGATLIDDPAAGRLLIFGGKDWNGALEDLWSLALP